MTIATEKPFNAMSPEVSEAELDARYREICGNAWLYAPKLIAPKSAKTARIKGDTSAPPRGGFDAMTAPKEEYEAAYLELTRPNRQP